MKLKPCPFCAGKCIKVAFEMNWFFLQCTGCYACGPNEVSQKIAIESWNTRRKAKK